MGVRVVGGVGGWCGFGVEAGGGVGGVVGGAARAGALVVRRRPVFG